MKQTAVEWLAEKMLYIDNEYDMKLITKSEYHAKRSDIIEEANEMFEQQIKDAYQTSHISMMTAEQYYNETFS
jgi:hypothetical protein